MDPLIRANIAFIKQDYKGAFEGYLECLRQKDDPVAACNLGFLYQAGIGTDKDLDMAVRYYRSSCYGDGGAGYFNLALLYQRGLGVPRDLRESLRLMKRSADFGCPNAQLYLALVTLLHYYYDPIDIECVSLIPFYHVVYRGETFIPLLEAGHPATDEAEENERCALVTDITTRPDEAGNYYGRLIAEHRDDPYAEQQKLLAKFMLGLTKIEGVDNYDPVGGFRLLAEAAFEGQPEAVAYLKRERARAEALGVRFSPEDVPLPPHRPTPEFPRRDLT